MECISLLLQAQCIDIIIKCICLVCLDFIPDNLVMSDPVFRQDDRYYHSTEEAFDRAMEKAVRYVQVCKEQGITNGVEKNLFAK